MDFSFLRDDLGYLLVGTFPAGPPGGALLSLLLAVSGALLSAGLGLLFGVALVMWRGPALWALQGEPRPALHAELPRDQADGAQHRAAGSPGS